MVGETQCQITPSSALCSAGSMLSPWRFHQQFQCPREQTNFLSLLDFTTPCLLETHPGKEYLQHFSFLQEALGKGRSCLPSVLSVQQQADCTQVLSVRLERGTEGPVVFLSLDLLLHLPFPLDFWCLTNQGPCLLTYTVALTLEEDSRGDTPL